MMSGVTDPAAALPPQTVRILTPVYDFKVEGTDSFTHAGSYKGADFNVVLRPYAGPADLDALVNLAHANNQPSIPQGCRRWEVPGTAGCHVLLVEVALPGSAYALIRAIATEVQLSTEEALRLHSAGLAHDDPMMFSDSPHLAIL